MNEFMKRTECVKAVLVGRQPSRRRWSIDAPGALWPSWRPWTSFAGGAMADVLAQNDTTLLLANAGSVGFLQPGGASGA